MCGILAILGLSHGPPLAIPRERALELQKKIRHRGPDWSGIHVSEKFIICHERLAIVDPESGDQPLFSRDDDSLVLAVNGEIYNHVELETNQFSTDHQKSSPLRTKSDCEILLKLFEKDGSQFLARNEVCGMFGCVLIDEREGFFVVARDHAGIIPLYMGRGKVDGAYWVGSELKCLVEDCSCFWEVPPG